MPTMKTWELHTSNDGTMLSGIWEATPVSGCIHFVFRIGVDMRSAIVVLPITQFKQSRKPIGEW